MAPRISLEQWRALLAVVDEGSYARAAKALHKSQSSVTYAVQKLESLLGVKAFKVQGRKAGLTPTGGLLYRRARYLLDEAMGLEQAAKKLSAGWEAEIHLAVETIFPTWLLLGCLARLGAESPHTRVELIETVLGGRDDTLLQSQAELAIFGTIPQGFMGESLMRVRFILAAHPDHPLHKLGRKLSIKDLRAHRQLVVRESSPRRATPLTMEATQRWTVSNLATSIEAARSGHGFAWRALRRAVPHLHRPRARRPGDVAPGRDHPRGGGERVQALRRSGEKAHAAGRHAYFARRRATFIRCTESPARWLQMKESRTSLSARRSIPPPASQ